MVVLLGSELVGLTSAVARWLSGWRRRCRRLRMMCRQWSAAMMGEISYAADWTEYGARVAGEDVAFPL